MRMIFNKFFQLISRDRSVAAFISIPKNASHSVRNILNLGERRDLDTSRSLVIDENHQRVKVLDQRYELDTLFTFCFSRNPYDRCVSWYEFHKQMKPYSKLSFEEWIRGGMPHHWTIQNQTNYISEDISPLLQYNFIEDFPVDFKGKIETFNSDMKTVIDHLNHICQQKGMNQPFHFKPLQINKRMKSTRYEDYYTDELKKIVYSMLEKDFDYFKYLQ